MFYCPEIQQAAVLSGEESQHAVRVLRLQAGDEIELVDGAGGYYKAVVVNPHPRHCEFEIKETFFEFGKRDYRIHIAIAPTKNIERLEWFIEKCTEIGVDEITPIICRYSERKIVKPERLEKMIVSAAKQSLKAYFPVLRPMCTFSDFIRKSTDYQKFIAHCYDNEKQSLQQVYEKLKDALILIGPEGDFSPDEVEKAVQSGFRPVSLGNSRLRTETAGIVACHTITLINEK